ncbi:MAG TPA: carotenoid biosynthesis protein [Chloroflexaceae bacterium]|nr:carotenoid biosynthesis protein [Chloroflexaceae bacterium]
MSTRLRLVVAALFAFYLFLYPGSITLVALDRVPVWGTWMGGALLILQGTLAGLWLTVNFGRRGAVAAAWVLFLSWLVEHVGATTGFPFGAYSYTDVLQPQVLGVVPLAIPFAWLLIVTAAVGTGELVLGRDGATAHAERRVSATKVLTAASFALLLDVTIEPFAVHINHYWVWSENAAGGYYGIPATNFAAWFVTSLLLSWVVLRYRARASAARPSDRGRPFWPWLPVTLYLTNLTMFVVVNLARGQGAAAAIGGLILLALACLWSLPRLARRLRGVGQESGA